MDEPTRPYDFYMQVKERSIARPGHEHTCLGADSVIYTNPALP